MVLVAAWPKATTEGKRFSNGLLTASSPRVSKCPHCPSLSIKVYGLLMTWCKRSHHSISHNCTNLILASVPRHINVPLLSASLFQPHFLHNSTILERAPPYTIVLGAEARYRFQHRRLLEYFHYRTEKRPVSAPVLSFLTRPEEAQREIKPSHDGLSVSPMALLSRYFKCYPFA